VIPERMRAVLLLGHGGPEMLEYREEVPVPEPGPGEVLLEVGACGMNNTDIWVREGAYGTEDDPGAVSTWRRQAPTLTFPRIQGADIVGRIVAAGARVSESRVGERVVVDFSLYNHPGDSLADIDYIGHGRDGGYAEYAAQPAENAYPVETDLTDAELATFCCAYLTGEHMLNRARVRAGETVLVTGASGGVGSGLVQLCRVRGAIPVAVTGRAKADAVRAVGAHAVVARDEADFRGAVAGAAQGRPLDVVADLVAGPLFRELLSVLRPEGRYVTSGAIAGPVVELDLRTVYVKHLDLIGCSQGTRGEFRDLLSYVLSGKVKPLLAGTYPLSRIHRAQEDSAERRSWASWSSCPTRACTARSGRVPRGTARPPGGPAARAAASSGARGAGVHHPDVGQGAVALRVVKAVAHHPHVRDVEAEVVDPDLHLVSVLLAHQRAGADRGRRARLEELGQVREGAPGVDDVLYHQDVTRFDVLAHVHHQAHGARMRAAAAVARQRDELDAVGNAEMAGQVGQEDERALEHCHQHEVLVSRVVALDGPRQLGDAGTDTLLRDQHARRLSHGLAPNGEASAHCARPWQG